MSIARINLSHSTQKEISLIVKNIRSVEKEAGHRILIALDTRGNELRISCKEKKDVLDGDYIKIVKSTQFDEEENVHKIGVNLKSFEFVKTGTKITFDDNKLSGEVIQSEDAFLMVKALNSHQLEDNKRVYFPDLPECSSMQGQDCEDIRFGILEGINMVFLSFVEGKSQLTECRKLIKDKPVQIISKIESLRGFKAIEDIFSFSDGIMIARGDLLNDVGVDCMFSIQKMLVYACKSKPMIMATEMLSSMVNRRFPTRSEISDIGNAVMDGCSAVMLSEETANGKYPLESIDVMRRVCIDAEKLTASLRSKKK